MKIEGSIAINKKIIDFTNTRSQLRYLERRIAFVLQEDLLFPTEKAKEAIETSALLRLPWEMSTNEKLEKAQNILKVLDLRRCADTKIGDDRVRGLSGDYIQLL